MRVSEIELRSFRRFHELRITGIPAEARLVVLAGPNGTGKSSLFDAFLLRYRGSGGFGYNNDRAYFNRSNSTDQNPLSLVTIRTHCGRELLKGSVYVRSSYRNDPDFETRQISHDGTPSDQPRLNKLIEGDATVGKNYQKLVGRGLKIFDPSQAEKTVGQFASELIGEVREPFSRLFPELRLSGLGDPLEGGTFRFEKGVSRDFHYKNLSGGEKSAFDLILDLVVHRQAFPDAIYCIDEPEAHMNTRVQGDLCQSASNTDPSSASNFDPGGAREIRA